MPSKRKPFFPPLISEYLPPANNYAEYIMGKTDPQGFGCKDFFVAQIPYQQAREIIVTHHYSHRFVNASYLHLGVYREGAFEGVLQFGYAMNPASAGKIVEGTVQGEYMELNRMWLSDDAPRNSESRAISYAIKYIKKVCPSVAWLQSFADERCGSLGVVYQAANFLYLGYHMSNFYMLDGEAYHKINVSKGRQGIRARYLQENIARAQKQTLRQFRYIYFIKTDWKKRLKLKVQTYPKRA